MIEQRENKHAKKLLHADQTSHETKEKEDTKEESHVQPLTEEDMLPDAENKRKALSQSLSDDEDDPKEGTSKMFKSADVSHPEEEEQEIVQDEEEKPAHVKKEKKKKKNLRKENEQMMNNLLKIMLPKAHKLFGSSSDESD